MRAGVRDDERCDDRWPGTIGAHRQACPRWLLSGDVEPSRRNARFAHRVPAKLIEQRVAYGRDPRCFAPKHATQRYAERFPLGRSAVRATAISGVPRGISLHERPSTRGPVSTTWPLRISMRRSEPHQPNGSCAHLSDPTNRKRCSAEQQHRRLQPAAVRVAQRAAREDLLHVVVDLFQPIRDYATSSCRSKLSRV